MKEYNSDLLKTGIDIIKQINEQGFEAYFVGGCVRDHVLSLPIKDIDITTSATTDDLADVFPTLIPIGIDHGTVLVRQHHYSFEITTYRGEQMDNTKVSQTCSLEEDLKYRDFTMNAIAMDTEMNLMDYHNGLEDIQSGVIRSVGSPRERIEEDPLRIMRAIRFMSQFGFTIEAQTKRAIDQLAHLLPSVAVERLLAECERIFAHTYCKIAVEQLTELKIDRYLPMFSNEPNLLSNVSTDIQPLKSFAEVIAVMHILAPEHTISTWCHAWKCSNQQKKMAKKMVHACHDAEDHGLLNPYLMYKLHDDVDAFYRVYSTVHKQQNIPIERLYGIQQELPITSRDELAIKGNDIIRLFPTLKPGKWIEDLLSTIEYKVVMRELPNTIISLKEWIICNPPETD